MARGSGGSHGDPGTDGQEYPGGTPAPATGVYETVNLFGRRTGHRVEVQQGETLPVLPRGFGWVVVQSDLPPAG